MRPRSTRGATVLRRLLLLTASFILAASGWFLLGDEISRSPETIRSIAVLPLENLTGDPGQEYFADGMTEAVIGDLVTAGDRTRASADIYDVETGRQLGQATAVGSVAVSHDVDQLHSTRSVVSPPSPS